MVEARIDAAVASAVAPFNVAIQLVATPRLRVAATYCQSYTFVVDTASLSVACAGEGALTVPFDGSVVAGTSARGTPYEVVVSWENGGATLNFTGPEGWQKVRYIPRADGGLRVEKTIHSTMLDTNVWWATDFVSEG